MDLSTFDVRAYFADQHVQYWEAGKNVSRGWLGIACPYCVDAHNHLGINLVYKSFSCWKCKASGSMLQLIQDMQGIGWREAKRVVEAYQTLGPIEPDEPDRLKDVGQSILPVGVGRHWGKHGLGRHGLTENHERYLRRRRFDPDALVEEWGICSATAAAPTRWAYRIIIPVVLDGRTVTWVGLDYSGVKDVKYKAASLEESFMSTNELVYGADKVGETVVIVEGITDAWRIGPGAVATFGMGRSTARMRLLRNLDAKRYYVMYDAEPQAQENAKELAHALGTGGREALLINLSRGDPDDLPDLEVQGLRAELGL